MARGTCDICGCTEAQACAGGCAWTDASETHCTTCDLGADLAVMFLAVLSKVPHDELPTEPTINALDRMTPTHRQLVVMGSRAIVEAVQASIGEDLELLTTELRQLMDALDARFPEVSENTETRSR